MREKDGGVPHHEEPVLFRRAGGNAAVEPLEQPEHKVPRPGEPVRIEIGPVVERRVNRV